MCLTLAELRAALSAYAAGFDADVLAPAQLAAALGDAGAIEKMAGAVSSLVAARMAMGSGLLGGNGTGKGGRAGSAQRAAQALAQASGTSLGDARRAIEAGQALAGLPEVAAAARAGELSRPQAWLVAGAAGANPAATTALLEKARTGALGELAEEAGRARAAVEDLDARRRALRGARSLRSWTGPLGTWQLVARDRLCRHHHGLKTHQGWALVPGRGKRPFVPPDDPRHPGPAPGPETGSGHAPRTGPAHDPGPGPGPREAHPPGPASGPAPSGPAPYRPAPSGPARHSDRA